MRAMNGRCWTPLICILEFINSYSDSQFRDMAGMKLKIRYPNTLKEEMNYKSGLELSWRGFETTNSKITSPCSRLKAA